jgi:hypothetical protein
MSATPLHRLVMRANAQNGGLLSGAKRKKLAVTTKNWSGRYRRIERREAIARERADQQVVCSPGANASASVARGISCLGRDQISAVAFECVFRRKVGLLCEARVHSGVSCLCNRTSRPILLGAIPHLQHEIGERGP